MNEALAPLIVLVAVSAISLIGYWLFNDDDKPNQEVEMLLDSVYEGAA